MKAMVAIVLATMTMSAFAVNGTTPKITPAYNVSADFSSESISGAAAGAVSDANSTSSSVSDALSVSGSMSDAYATGGEAYAAGGAGGEANANANAAGGAGGSSEVQVTTGDSVSEGGESSSSLTFNNRQRRQVGAIAMTHPQATMQCIRGFGIGGANSNFSMLIGPQWKDGECMALMQFNQLVEMDLPFPAAKVYCSLKRFAKPFPSVDSCEAAIVQSLVDRRVTEVEVVEKIVEVPGDCPEKLRRCENVTGRK